MTGYLISVVDDDESIRRSTKLLIESFGYRAAVFESAEMFLRSGQLRDTSCLILDIHMPGTNGLELQSQLAARKLLNPYHFHNRLREQRISSTSNASWCCRVPGQAI